MSPPAIICVGKSVLMRQALDWQSMISGNSPRNTDPLNRGRPAEASGITNQGSFCLLQALAVGKQQLQSHY